MDRTWSDKYSRGSPRRTLPELVAAGLYWRLGLFLWQVIPAWWPLVQLSPSRVSWWGFLPLQATVSLSAFFLLSALSSPGWVSSFYYFLLSSELCFSPPGDEKRKGRWIHDHFGLYNLILQSKSQRYLILRFAIVCLYISAVYIYCFFT